jgi:succinate dehydrogenase / fumarate reductase cytochrome b subunit
MKTSNRPLSPHLQVYKMPLSAKLSILHRLTGLALSFAAVVLVYWLFSLAYMSGSAISLYAFFSTTIGKVLLMAFTFAFFYHFCNGIRHLFWDVGKGFELEQVNRSGIMVVVIAAAITAFIWVWEFNHAI